MAIQVIYRNFTDSASGIRSKYKHEAQAQASQRDSALAYSLALMLVLIRSIRGTSILLTLRKLGGPRQYGMITPTALDQPKVLEPWDTIDQPSSIPKGLDQTPVGVWLTSKSCSQGSRTLG